MRSLLLFPLALLLAALILVPACSRNDDEVSGGPVDPVGNNTGDALAEYWEAGEEAGTALTEVNDLWATFAGLAADPDVPAETTLQAAEDYAAAGDGAAAFLRIWRDLEASVAPQNKAQLSDEARDTALEVLDVAAAAATSGGEALIISWQALGGLAGLREALGDPEGTVPVTGLLADALEARLAHRDDLVEVAILADDSRSGALPLDQFEGDTPAERAAWYRDLDGNHAIKRQCRAAVPGWDTVERDASLALLERAARGQLRHFADVGPGGPSLAELADHLTGALENGQITVHEVTFDLRDGVTDEAIAGEAMLIVRRRDQPDETPRLAILAGTVAQVVAELPAGAYDLVALAPGWARDIAVAAATAEGGVITLRLSHLAQQTVILEGIEAPGMAGAGQRVDLRALAASTNGDAVRFAWEIRGGATETFNPSDDECTFTPAAAGTYTAVVTARDDHGAAAVDSVAIEVTSFAVEVFRTEFLIEQLDDFHFNPGEQDTLWLWIANRGSETVVGSPRLTGRDGFELDLSEGTWTLDAGRQTRWQVPVALPADYDEPRLKLDFSFTSGDETLVQELDFRVDFYCELNYIPSPVTSRVLSISGVVANPGLDMAQLIIDRDRNHVYNLPLENGAFEQVVILPGSEDARRIRLEVVAEAGNRRETASAGFMAAVTRADFRATLFWDTNGTDVDLWVTDPDGERCYFGNHTTASGLELDVDDVTGFGPENITGETSLPPGDYLVQVHYWSDHGTGLASHCTVLITLHEGTENESIESYEQTITDGQVWDVATVTWDGAQAVAVTPAPRNSITVVPRMNEK